ncbi:Golgi reassembly-stacking protein 2 [Nymphon striatum]|nr:Golgi reassembly-stacking protein 2 [Nymphon striatum]
MSVNEWSMPLSKTFSLTADPILVATLYPGLTHDFEKTSSFIRIEVLPLVRSLPKVDENVTEKNATKTGPILVYGKMKKSAPPPPPPLQPSGTIPHKVAVIAHNPDDSAINELLEGRMELEVVLPGNKIVKMTVERRMPMMDLLVQVTSANKITPGGHFIHVVTERGNDIVHYKPNTPIGSLDTNTIHVVPKNSVITPPVKKLPKVINQPFEQTFRLQVNLPRNQLAVLRVSPKSTLADIHRMTCEDKALDPSKYDLRHPNHLDEPLDQNRRLSQYGMNEITLVSSHRSNNGNLHGSTSDILALRTKDEDKKKKGLFGFQWKRRSKFSLDSQGEDPNSRGVSPTRSDSSGGGYTSSDARSTSPNRPITYHEGISVTARPNKQISHIKKRPAPPPPLQPSTSQQSSTTPTQESPVSTVQTTTTEKISEKQTMPIVSHSRHSSDSSGYHEASVLSDALDSMPTTQSSSPTTSLDTNQSVRSQTHINEAVTTPNILSRPKSMSCSNVSVASTTVMKKRRAPAPPQISRRSSASKTAEDIPSELETAIEQIEQCSRLNQNGDIHQPSDEDYKEFVFSSSTSITRADSALDTIGGGINVKNCNVSNETDEEDLANVAHTQSLDESDSSVNASTNNHPMRNKKKHRFIRQSTINIPITENNHEWGLLEDAFSSKLKENVFKVNSKMPPEKPKRRLSSRHSLHRTHTTNKSVDGEDETSLRTYSLSSQDTLNDIETSFEQTITFAENMISQENSHDTSLTSDEAIIKESEEPTIYTQPTEIKLEEKKIFQETRAEDECSDVTEPEKTFFAVVEEISNTSIEQSKSRSDSETSISSSNANTCISASSDLVAERTERHPSLSDSTKSNSNESNQYLDEPVKSDYSSSSESSVDSQIHIPSAPSLPQQGEATEKKYITNSQEVIEVTEVTKVTKVVQQESSVREIKVSSTLPNVRIQTYESQAYQNAYESEKEKAEIESEVSENPKVLSSHFSSMQDLHKSSCEEPSSKVQDDVETTMRKVQSEVDIMVSQRKPDDGHVNEQEELQDQYKKLQEKFMSWQKKLADNQTLLDSEHKALIEQSSVTIDVSEIQYEEKAETLPRVNKKQETSVKPRPIRHRPSVIIGSWSDQNNDLHKKYKTEIKIRTEEIEEQKREETRVTKLEASKPSFRISHSKIDTDIFSSSNDPVKSPVKSPVRSPSRGPAVPAKPTAQRSFSEESPHQRQSPQKSPSMPSPQTDKPRSLHKSPSIPSPQTDKPRSPYAFSTWSKLEINDNKPLPVFRKRGVTTNNKGELVVKESYVDNSVMEMQNRAIKEAKTQMMEQFKSKVRERSESEKSTDSIVSQNGSINRSPVNEKYKSLSKEPLVESNIVIKDHHGNETTPNRFESKKDVTNGQIVSNESVYIENIKNLSGGEKENVCNNNNNNNNNNNIPPPPPPPPSAPVPVPNLQKSKNVNILNSSPPIIINKRKPRKIVEPKLDTREELMLAIRNFGGRPTLRKLPYIRGSISFESRGSKVEANNEKICSEYRGGTLKDIHGEAFSQRTKRRAYYAIDGDTMPQTPTTSKPMTTAVWLPRSQSVEIPGGGTEGYHVLRVQDNSPGQKAGLESFFDFIVAIGNTRLNQDNDALKEMLKVNTGKPIQMTVYSSKTQQLRNLSITPLNMWGGQGLLGVSIRFCSFEGANENVWHVLDVHPMSPAELAGLQPFSDYIIGADSVLHESEDLFTLIDAHEARPLKLYVYNIDSDSCREVTISPNRTWGGEGSLGCGIGYGYLHRIPTTSTQVIKEGPSPIVPSPGPLTNLPATVPINPVSPPPQEGFASVPLSTVDNLNEDLANKLNVSEIRSPAQSTGQPTIPVPSALFSSQSPIMESQNMYSNMTAVQNPMPAPAEYQAPVAPDVQMSQIPQMPTSIPGMPYTTLPGMPFTTPISLPGMPPITVSATVPTSAFSSIPTDTPISFPQTVNAPPGDRLQYSAVSAPQMM